jgi:hypothetical protein
MLRSLILSKYYRHPILGYREYLASSETHFSEAHEQSHSKLELGKRKKLSKHSCCGKPRNDAKIPLTIFKFFLLNAWIQSLKTLCIDLY